MGKHGRILTLKTFLEMAGAGLFKNHIVGGVGGVPPPEKVKKPLFGPIFQLQLKIRGGGTPPKRKSALIFG